MSRILITGAESGLGLEMSKALLKAGHEVESYDLSRGYDVRKPNTAYLSDLRQRGLDVLINNAGINLINWLERFSEDDWDNVMDTNTKGIYLMSKACLPALKESKGTILNIISNASHMPMTCSLAYNASKGAAHIMTKQLARELTKRHGITVFGLAPNKLEGTRMSQSIEKQVVETRGWTLFDAHKYQINALLTGEETPPALVAEFVAFLLASKERHKFLTGCIIPYGA